ncbi:hypothetical protein GE09DRAFT_1089169 [Coniochaeta sp. 2T2.1]|nr:hypothetical protein GE09DRAFT_1089169 [Coniochaeta sp. 2T2.1]
MCLVFTCGETTFRREVEGYEGIVCRCHNCGNYSAKVVKSKPWFTFCFVPVIPLSMKGYQDVTCSICNFAQPLEHRQDVQQMRGGGGAGQQGMPLQPQGPYPPGPSGGPGGAPPQGWGGSPVGGQPDPNKPMHYR